MELHGKNDAVDLIKMERLFITGVLDELKLCFSYSDQVRQTVCIGIIQSCPAMGKN